MSILLLSKRAWLCDLFKAALRTFAVLTFPESTELLASLLEHTRRPAAMVVTIDISDRLDSAHLIQFVRSSPATAHVPILGIGSSADYDALDPESRAGLTELLHIPISAEKIMRAIDKHAAPSRPHALNDELRLPRGGPGEPFTAAALRQQIQLLRRYGLTISDHAGALNVQPDSSDYVALAELWQTDSAS